MNAVTDASIAQAVNDKDRGLYGKFRVERTDGSSAPGGKHENDDYFVLNLTTDKFTIPALRAYANACQDDYPLLAADLRTKIRTLILDEFVTVPETTLPNGTVVPSFQVGKYLTGKGDSGELSITADAAPWVGIDYYEARKVAIDAGYQLITELQALALAYNIANVADNWSQGKVGEGELCQGIHDGTEDEAREGAYTPEFEGRWFTLSNGQQICDAAGNAFTWVFDDVQGDENGIVARAFTPDSPSVSTSPYPSVTQGAGWQPLKTADWSGYALIRGGCWGSVDDAGVFRLGHGVPHYAGDGVGFRCTKPVGP